MAGYPSYPFKRGILQRYKKDFPRLHITDIFFTRKL